MVLQEDTEEIMTKRVNTEEVLWKQKCTYIQNQKVTADTTWAHNEEDRLGKFDTPRT